MVFQRSSLSPGGDTGGGSVIKRDRFRPGEGPGGGSPFTLQNTAPVLPPITPRDDSANLPPSMQGVFNPAATPTGAAAPLAPTANTNPEFWGVPPTGFASRYTGGSPELLQREPGIVLADTLASMGINPNGGVYGLLEPGADLVNALFQIFAGGESGGYRTPSDAINYFNQFFEQQATPGGSTPSFGGGMAEMLNAPTDSPLGLFLRGAQDPRSQVENFRALSSALASGGMPLLMQEAFNNQMALMARDYLRAHAEGRLSRGDFPDYVGARRSMQNLVGPQQQAANAAGI